jgi:hypothetical protein
MSIAHYAEKNPEGHQGTTMRVADISGMDPERKRYDYEWGCQVIMLRALHWMREHAVEARGKVGLPRTTPF